MMCVEKAITIVFIEISGQQMRAELRHKETVSPIRALFNSTNPSFDSESGDTKSLCRVSARVVLTLFMQSLSNLT